MAADGCILMYLVPSAHTHSEPFELVHFHPAEILNLFAFVFGNDEKWLRKAFRARTQRERERGRDNYFISSKRNWYDAFREATRTMAHTRARIHNAFNTECGANQFQSDVNWIMHLGEPGRSCLPTAYRIGNPYCVAIAFGVKVCTRGRFKWKTLADWTHFQLEFAIDDATKTRKSDLMSY